MTFQTEFEFTFPMGYVDDEGNLHKKGIMRLATGHNEILPLKDTRVQANPASETVILLSRVIMKLGDLPVIDTKVTENLFASDFYTCRIFTTELTTVAVQTSGQPALNVNTISRSNHIHRGNKWLPP